MAGERPTVRCCSTRTDSGRVAATHIFFRPGNRRLQHEERRVELSVATLSAVRFLTSACQSFHLVTYPVSFRSKYRLWVCPQGEIVFVRANGASTIAKARGQSSFLSKERRQLPARGIPDSTSNHSKSAGGIAALFIRASQDGNEIFWNRATAL